MARKYTQVTLFEKNIYRLKEEGKTDREITDECGLGLKQLKNLINRHNHTEEAKERGVIPHRMGRPRERTCSRLIKGRIPKLGVFVWKMSCCGIFFTPLEGCEAVTQI